MSDLSQSSKVLTISSDNVEKIEVVDEKLEIIEPLSQLKSLSLNHIKGHEIGKSTSLHTINRSKRSAVTPPVKSDSVNNIEKYLQQKEKFLCNRLNELIFLPDENTPNKKSECKTVNDSLDNATESLNLQKLVTFNEISLINTDHLEQQKNKGIYSKINNSL
jgi:hypothetical protein